MFVQVIQGRAKDPAGLKKQSDRWAEELKPGSIGFLGSTAGVTDDGQFFAAARFESEEAARRNSDRPEQTQWWEETSQYIDGEATFLEYPNVEPWLGGGSDDAGFVQAMQGRITDLERMGQLDKESEQVLREARPDLIGGLRCWQDDGSFTTINYFTSEREAREGESKEPSPEVQERFAEWMTLMQDLKYLDIREPWLVSM